MQLTAMADEYEPNNEVRASMAGKLNFQDFSDGLHVHGNDVVETRNTQSTVMLPTSLNLTVLLKGKVEFCLAKNTYSFDSSNGIISFCNILSSPTPFTRYLKRNQRVKKITISVSQNWLLSRCHHQQDFARLTQLFTNTNVTSCLPTTNMIQISNSLLAIGHTHDMAADLQKEWLAVKLIQSFLSEQSRHKQTGSQQKVRLKQCIDELLETRCSLNHIANTLGMSVSTLQRKFKEIYNVTAVKYMRIQRLEQARIAIEDNKMSIGEAAYVAGYNHSSNFITAFKKHFNITPANLLNQ